MRGQVEAWIERSAGWSVCNVPASSEGGGTSSVDPAGDRWKRTDRLGVPAQCDGRGAENPILLRLAGGFGLA